MEFAPSTYPPFPSGIPSVELETFSLAELEKGNDAVEDKLFETCKSRGFFYLDIKGSKADSMKDDSEAVGRLAEEVFGLSMDEKLNYPFRNSLFGYVLSALSLIRRGSAGSIDFCIQIQESRRY